MYLLKMTHVYKYFPFSLKRNFAFSCFFLLLVSYPIYLRSVYFSAGFNCMLINGTLKYIVFLLAIIGLLDHCVPRRFWPSLIYFYWKFVLFRLLRCPKLFSLFQIRQCFFCLNKDD